MVAVGLNRSVPGTESGKEHVPGPGASVHFYGDGGPEERELSQRRVSPTVPAALHLP